MIYTSYSEMDATVQKFTLGPHTYDEKDLSIYLLALAFPN